MKKWLVGLMGLGLLATAAMGALTSPATLPVEYAGANGWSNSTLDAMTGWDATGLGTPYAAPNASAKFDGAGDNIVIYFDSAPGEIVYSVRRSDSAALTNGTYEAKLQESADNTTYTDVRTFDGSELNGTLALFTNTLLSSSRYVKFIYVTKPTGQNFGIGYVKISTGGPATFQVTFDQPNGFTIDQGTTDVITATAANGTAPYSYSWSSTLAGTHYTAAGDAFTIKDTAPVGSYSAQVVATDNAAKSVTNSINFSVVLPAAKYAITITPPVNGTVTTTPATEAEAGQNVTINATPAGGYAVDTYSVVGADTTVIGTSSSFTMPAQAVTVTVTFKVHTGSSLIISEVADPSDNTNARFVELYNAGGSSIDLTAGTWYLGRQANGGTFANIALTGTVEAAHAYIIAYSASNYALAYPTAPAPNVANGNITGNGDDGYFLYSGGNSSNGVLEDAYGVVNQDGTGMPWEYTDGRAVRHSEVTAGNSTWTASEWSVVTGTVTAAMMTPGVHPDGAAVFSVTFDKANGFTVNQGAGAAITATAANGTAPYSYAWTSSMQPADYAAVNNVFTINAAAPVGSYWARVVATDNAAASVTNTINFSIVAVSDTATLPTSFSGPGWYQGTGLPSGWTQVGLGTDYATSLDADGAAAKFDTTADSLQIKYDSAATQLTYWMQLNGAWTNSNVFKVQESVNGTDWTDLVVYDDANPISGTKAQFTNTPNASSRYIKFVYVTKGSGNVGLDGVSITGGGGGATVVIGGATSGTVGSPMNLTITLQNGVANDWIIVLKDPDNADVTVYNWNPGTGAFSFTPAKSGSYHLSATALDAGSAPIDDNSVTLTVSGGGNPPITSITPIPGTGFSFQVPAGHVLSRVEGASALSGNAWVWTTLSSPTDYTVSGSTVTILRAPATKRMVRIVMNP